MKLAFLLLLGLACYLLAALAWLALSWRNPWRSVALLAVAFATLAAPWALPEIPRVHCLLASMGAIALATKLYDLSRGPALAPRPAVVGYLLWLGNVFTLVFRKPPPAAGRLPAQEAARLVAAGGLGSLGAVAIAVSWFNPLWGYVGFWPEHCLKVLLFFCTIWAVSAAGASAMRLLGSPAMELMIAPGLSRTPADFWRRYNRPVNQFLHEYVFLRAGGLSRPGPAILLAFFVSGLIHEYVFFAPIGRICGYQMAFFLVQGLAVAATARFRPKAGLAVISFLATAAFMLFSASLFCASLNAVTPFYVCEVPSWLRCGVK